MKFELTVQLAVLILTTTLAAYCAADELTIETFDNAVATLEVSDPTSENDPLSMNATLVATNPSPGDTVMAVLKIRIMPTWYIYKVVPKSQPFIESEWILDSGPELEQLYDWSGPPATAHTSLPNTTIHASSAKDILFFHELKVAQTDSDSATATVGISYQICNPEYCLPVRTKTKELTIDLAQK